MSHLIEWVTTEEFLCVYDSVFRLDLETNISRSFVC